ncbi:uncharacterized protein LOC107639980 [Arachis ipaensis]|uniref:uncharacterized protein LOC107639980 n=1 Tax=Arachis ipaensis TaxID=130454 RepID=UPI0007AF83B0|nr:uncharacterized protein LOC107639980 [Arachis ipaensis]
MGQGKGIILKYSTNISSFVAAKSSLWVIDTGATDHVTFDLNDFESYIQTSPIIVRMPDGSQTVSSTIGTIRFSNQLYITNVLFIPNFDFKLISVSKITNGLKCQMLINDQICEIQDQATLKRIGVAKCADELYTMDSQAVVGINKHVNHFIHDSSTSPHIYADAVTLDSNYVTTHTANHVTALWHSRLGHVSRYPISQYISYDALSPKHKSFSLAVATTVVPSNYEEAIVHPCWREAIHSELEALKQN